MDLLKQAREKCLDVKTPMRWPRVFEPYKKKQIENYLIANGRDWKTLYKQFVDSLKANQNASTTKLGHVNRVGHKLACHSLCCVAGKASWRRRRFLDGGVFLGGMGHGVEEGADGVGNNRNPGLVRFLHCRFCR